MDDAISINAASASVEEVDAPVAASAFNGFGNGARPDAKARRYDRQLRLWGSSGQGGLENAKMLLINPMATGTQTLKNLVLPGIGNFEVLSADPVTAEDVGQNFFLMLDSLGKPIAQETVRFLSELNPSVNGTAKVAAVDELLETDPRYFLDFSIVIAVNLPAATEDKLAALLWAASDPSSDVTASNGAHPDIPLLLARSAGFMGLLRIQLREHCIVDTHPSSLASLRIDCPFDELVAHAESVDFAKLESMEHGNVPFVVILVRALAEWKKTHDGQQPKWSGKGNTKAEFLTLVDQMRRHGDEENFAEAQEKGYLAAQKTTLPREIEEILHSDRCINVTKDSKPFHLLCNALRAFIRSPSNPSRLLPVSAALPDMKASTSAYVSLQNVYKAKAKADLEAIGRHLRETLRRVGLDEDAVGEAELADFVKNAAFLKVISGRSLRQEREETDFNKEAILSFHPDPDWNVPYVPPPIVQYIAFRAADIFHASHGRFPGVGLRDSDGREQEADCEADVGVMESITAKWLAGRGWSADADADMGDDGSSSSLPRSVRDAVGEIVRAGRSDLPTTAAFLGGVVSQEAIKLLTVQYVPLNNTAVVDMIRGSTGAYEL